MSSVSQRIPVMPIDDPVPLLDGDGRLLGVDMRDPATLTEGMVSEAINMRFEDGVAEPRRGIMAMAWTNRTSSTDDTLILPYGDVHGAGVYSDPATHAEWIITAADGVVWKTREGNGSSLVPLPEGVTLAGRVHFIDAFQRLYLQRGPDLATLVMSNIDEGFVLLPEPETGGNLKLPDSETGIWFGNRLYVPFDQDWLFASDLMDPDEGAALENTLRIHAGEVDPIVGLYRFNDTTIIVGKGRGYHFVSGLYGDSLGTTAVLDTITEEYGLAAAHSFAQVGSDVWSLAHGRGIVSVTQTEYNKLHAVDVPVSLKIQGLIDNINWAEASGAVSAFWGNRFYCAVPVGTVDYNNTVLVYDTRNKEWAGYDYGDAIAIREWIKFTYAGQVRLGFVSDDGYIKLYEEGFYDDVPNAFGVMDRQPIQTSLLTRGYWGARPGLKRLLDFTAYLQTWGPSLNLIAQSDGVRELVTIEDGKTRSRTVYDTPFDASPWDPSNTNDDFHTPGRQDYSILPGTGIYCRTNGWTPDLHQDWRLRRRARVRGRYVQIRIENAAGRAKVMGLQVRGLASTNRKGVVI